MTESKGAITVNRRKDHILTEMLLIRYRRGDHSALDELVKLWEAKLFYYIMRLVSSEEDAWDGLQETWLALTKNIGKLRESRSLVLWLYKTARHKAMDRLRERYSEQTVPMEYEDLSAVEDPKETFAFEDAELVHNALAQLSPHQREVLTLYFLEDLSIDEISQVLSVAPGTIKSRLHYAKKAMRTILEGEEILQ